MDPKQKAALAIALGLSESASDEDIVQAAKATADERRALERIYTVLGHDLGDDPDAVVAEITGLRANALSPEERQALEARAAEGDKVRRETAVEAAVRAGKIVASNKQWAQQLAERDLGEFEQWAASAPVVVATAGKQKQPPAEQGAFDPEADPTEEQIKQLAKKPEVIKAAKDAAISPESFVKANWSELAAE